MAILNQSSTSILDQSSTSILDSTLAEFGHGTMVAGIVHLIAPTAKIMPLKAFHADGSSNLSDIIRAIYFAADHGANVISMSFSMPQSSPGLQAAIQYALSKNVVLIAASGNDGLKTLVFPASYNGVEGIGSTTNTDLRSSTFSNYGSGVVTFAAPGEGVVTTYPGGSYAAGWGTSFSTPMVRRRSGSGVCRHGLQANPVTYYQRVSPRPSRSVTWATVASISISRLRTCVNSSGTSVSTSTSGSGTRKHKWRLPCHQASSLIPISKPS